MKKLLIILLTIALLIAAFFLLMPKRTGVVTSGLPWQIELHDDGTSSVFGIHLGGTTFNEAGMILGIDREVAVMINRDNEMSLEMFYSYFQAGPLGGKLVLAAEAHPTLLEQLAERASSGEYLSTGSRKFTLAKDDLEIGDTLLIKSMTFVPSATLDEAIIEGRFGKPDVVIKASEESTHYLFSKLGLDVVLNKEGKEALQYVAPKDFARLKAPLQQVEAEEVESQDEE